jgi:hypothetical protein
MPQVAVADMEIHEPRQDLVVATHGRGIFRLNLQPLYEMMKPVWNSETNHLMELAVGQRPRLNTSGGGVDKRSVEKLPVNFWLTQEGEVKLAVMDGSGEQVWQHIVKGKRGFNTFMWDLVTKRRESDLPYYTEYETYLNPGSYTLTMTVEGEVIKVLSRPFKIVTSAKQ